jgi:transcriptional regulator with GAF, ATPase, and Fis domain
VVIPAKCRRPCSEFSFSIAARRRAKREKIVSFAGHPLTFRDEVRGVLAVFSRGQLGARDFEWLRIFADSAGAAIANARASEEIDRLRQQPEQESDYPRAEEEAAGEFGDIVGRSPALRKALRQVELVAPSDAAVPTHGETGTGKELAARAVHERSPRRGRPLIRVNCGAVLDELFESEFFGHVKGPSRAPRGTGPGGSSSRTAYALPRRGV